MLHFSEFKSLSVSVENAIAHIQLSRTESLNNMNRDFWFELPAAIEQLEQSGEARVIVLSAQGKLFTAGMDLEIFQSWISGFDGEPARRGEGFRRWVLELQQAFNCLEEVRIPVIAAIQGACIGGGVDMVCA